MRYIKWVPFVFSSICLVADTSSLIFQQGDIPPEGAYSYGYNAPSQVKLQNAESKILPDFFIDASFIYYHADEEGLDLGTSAALVSETDTFVAIGTSNSKTAFQPFDYKPGFKVGAGVRLESWTLAGEYTWIRQTTNTTQTAPNPNITNATGVWILNDWFQQLAPSGQTISASTIYSKWHLSMNLADLLLSRAFYQSSHLSLIPSFGLRAAWISQQLNIGINIPTDVIANQVAAITNSNNSSHSWGIGPKAALAADLLLGKGFRFEGGIGTSLLFTKYTSVVHSENVATVGSIPSTLGSKYSNYCCIRPVAEAELGLGWGTYLFDQKFHIDFAATYDFALFWNQNMMRKLVDSTVSGEGSSAGNLNLHGLTITAQFDF